LYIKYANSRKSKDVTIGDLPELIESY
jgi:hypothetical protein